MNYDRRGIFINMKDQIIKPVDAAAEDRPDLVEGRNAVIEALRAGRPVDKIYMASGETDRTLGHIAAKAREAGVVVSRCDRRKLDAMSSTGAHQGVIAVCAAREYCELSDLIDLAHKRGEDPFLIACDELADPHNLGAVIRTAECAGAHGIVIPRHRSAGVTAVVEKASAGAVEYLKVARVANLNRTIDELKEKNIWVYGTAMDGTPVKNVRFEGGVALVVGAEGEGLSRLAREKCDQIISLPMKGHIDSLNASVAAGIVMYAVLDSRL